MSQDDVRVDDSVERPRKGGVSAGVGSAAGARGLRRNAIGVPGMVFLALAGMTPLSAMSSNIALGLGFGVGAATILVILVIGAILVFFTMGYVVLSRYVTSAGAYQAFVAFGLGSRAGTGVAFAAALNYMLASGAFVAATGYFASLTLKSMTGVEVPWWAFAIVAIIIAFVTAFRGVSESSRLTTIVSLAQLVMIGVLAIAVLIQRPTGWLAPEIVSPEMAFGPGLGFTLVFSLLLFTGYETTAVFGEEVKAPRRSVAIATYMTLGILLVVMILATWILVAAFDDVQATAAEDPGAIVSLAAERYLGAWSAPLLNVLITISVMGAVVTTFNLSMRYLFTLGRDGVLPRRLARTHVRYDTPYVGLIIVATVAALVLAPFAVAGADPIANLFPVISAVTSLAAAGMMVGASISVIVAKRRGRVSESKWTTIVAPVAGAAGLVTILILILVYYPEVTGSDSPAIYLMPVALVLVVLTGFLAAGRRQRTKLEPLDAHGSREGSVHNREP